MKPCVLCVPFSGQNARRELHRLLSVAGDGVRVRLLLDGKML